MKRKISIPIPSTFIAHTTWAFILVFLWCCNFTVTAQEKERGVNIGIVYPLSTHGTNAWAYANVFSLHTFGGASREEKAFTASGFCNLVLGDARGFQAAGFVNIIGGTSEGFQGAGFLNLYRGARGFQGAGFGNLSKGDVRGTQAAGFINIASNIEGFQGAGFINIADNVLAVQAAGYVNIADSVKGAQLSGFINVADNVEGAQVAGFINIAKKVKGVQAAGFINIADSSDYPIGIINLIKNGEKRIGVTTDDNLTTLLTFRSGGRKLYGIIGAGYNFKNSKHVLAIQYGLGAHIVSKNNFRLNAEYTGTTLENFRRGSFDKFTLSVLPAMQFGAFEVFAGPSFSYVNTNTDEGRKLVDHYVWDDISSDRHLNGLYIGYTAGVHMKM